MEVPARFHPMPFADLPPDASPYGPDPRRSAGYVLDRSRAELGFEPSSLEDAVAETLAWYRVAKPSHAGYANRAKELALAGIARNHQSARGAGPAPAAPGVVVRRPGLASLCIAPSVCGGRPRGRRPGLGCATG